MAGLLGDVGKVGRRGCEARGDDGRHGVDARHGLAAAPEDDRTVEDLVGRQVDTGAALDAEQTLASLAEVDDAAGGLRSSERGIHEKLRGLGVSCISIRARHSDSWQRGGGSCSKLRRAG
jgi:hypothetical protein